MTTNFGITNGIPNRGVGGNVAFRKSPVSLNESYGDGRQLPLYDYQQTGWFAPENSVASTWLGALPFSSTTENSAATVMEVPFDIGFEGVLTDISVWVNSMNGTATPSITYAVYDYEGPFVRKLVKAAGSAPFSGSAGTRTVSGLSIPVKRRFVIYAGLVGLDLAQANPTFGFHNYTPLFRATTSNLIPNGNNAPNFRLGGTLGINATSMPWRHTLVPITTGGGLGLAIRVTP